MVSKTLLAALLALLPAFCMARAVDFECRAQLQKQTGNEWQSVEDEIVDYVFTIKGNSLNELLYYRKGTSTIQFRTNFKPIIDGALPVADSYFDTSTGHFALFEHADDGKFVAVLELSSRLRTISPPTRAYKGRCKPAP